MRAETWSPWQDFLSISSATTAMESMKSSKKIEGEERLVASQALIYVFEVPDVWSADLETLRYNGPGGVLCSVVSLPIMMDNGVKTGDAASEGHLSLERPNCEETIAYGGIREPSMISLWSSDRVRAQENVDATQMERAIALPNKKNEHVAAGTHSKLKSRPSFLLLQIIKLFLELVNWVFHLGYLWIKFHLRLQKLKALSLIIGSLILK
jgi:hypothetical protein